MYEIWLALNILFELGLMYLPTLILLGAVWAALMAVAIVRGQAAWCAARRPAIVIGIVVTGVMILLTPSLTLSSLGELKYWVDWANLAAIAGGFGALAAALTLPLAATLKRAP